MECRTGDRRLSGATGRGGQQKPRFFTGLHHYRATVARHMPEHGPLKTRLFDLAQDVQL